MVVEYNKETDTLTIKNIIIKDPIIFHKLIFPLPCSIDMSKLLSEDSIDIKILDFTKNVKFSGEIPEDIEKYELDVLEQHYTYFDELEVGRFDVFLRYEYEFGQFMYWNFSIPNRKNISFKEI